MNSFITNSINHINEKSKELLESDNPITHPDFFKLSLLEDKASIGIKEVKTFVEKAFIKPFQAKHKVFVIENADLMTEEAQNSLLKLLEEPPVDTFFFLHTKNINDLLVTIKSRCQIVLIDEKPEFIAELPHLYEILKERYNKRYQTIDTLFDAKIAPNKVLAENLIEKFVYESEKVDNPEIKFDKIVSLCIEAKKHLANNATPKSVVELLFLKLPVWN